jgi:DNA-binding CsgD family transcriptional regulator/LysM repeat protein
LSAGLTRYMYAPMAALALWAVLLVVSPDVATAQGTDPPKDAQGTERVVVVPGDSLWSISREQLGPNATPQQIATAVERIYALNQNRIGGDPNLIFAGQKLSLPPIGEPSMAERSTGATPAREAIKPAEATPSERAAKSSTNRASKTPVGKAASKRMKAPDSVAEPAFLPDAAAPTPVSAVRSLASKDSPRSPVVSFASAARSAVSAVESAIVGTFPDDNQSRRKLLGLSIMAFSLLLAALMAWKLPMTRNIGRSEAWRIPTGYPGGYAGYHTYAQGYDPPELTRKYSSTATGPSSDPAPSSGDATAAGNDLGRVNAVGIAPGKRQRRRNGRTPIQRRLPRKGLATEAHNPKVRRTLLRGAAKTRSQRSANNRAKGIRRGGVGSTKAIVRKLKRHKSVEHGHQPNEDGIELIHDEVCLAIVDIDLPLGLVVGEESRPELNIHLLSARQREILQLVAEELPNAQIARRLFITESTVKQHLHKAYKILGVRNRREAAKFLGRKDQAERHPVTAVGVRP